jgi:hypothetical protein
MEGKLIAAFGRPFPSRLFATDRDLLAAEPCLVADDGAGATLALQAMAHRNAQRLALDCEVKPPATAGGAPGRHCLGSAATLDKSKTILIFVVPPTQKGELSPRPRYCARQGQRKWANVAFRLCPHEAEGDVRAADLGTGFGPDSAVPTFRCDVP